MDLQTGLHSQTQFKSFAQLSSKPTAYYRNEKEVFVSFADHSLSAYDIGTSTFSKLGHNMHEKRINCIREYNNILITGSNDFTVRLWDRATGKLIHKFLKPGSEFNVLDISEHILCAAHTSKLVFWDIRKMKQRAEFNDSFNGQITCLKFNPLAPKQFMGCSVDGMISKFDLTQPNEEQAFMWCTKVLESPSKLHTVNNMTLVETTNHILYLLEDEDIKKRIVVNDFDEPKHVLNSNLLFRNGNYDLEYYSWNLEKQIVEKWQNDKVVGYIQGVEDSEIFVSLSGEKVLYLTEKGDAYLKNVQKSLEKPKVASKQPQMNIKKKQQNKWQKVEEEKPANQNGFILNRPTSFKSNTKKFKPY